MVLLHFETSHFVQRPCLVMFSTRGLDFREPNPIRFQGILYYSPEMYGCDGLEVLVWARLHTTGLSFLFISPGLGDH